MKWHRGKRLLSFQPCHFLPCKHRARYSAERVHQGINTRCRAEVRFILSKQTHMKPVRTHLSSLGIRSRTYRALSGLMSLLVPKGIDGSLSHSERKNEPSKLHQQLLAPSSQLQLDPPLAYLLCIRIVKGSHSNHRCSMPSVLEGERFGPFPQTLIESGQEWDIAARSYSTGRNRRHQGLGIHPEWQSLYSMAV